MYACYVCTDLAALRVFESKFIRKIIGSVRAVNDLRIRFNSQLYGLLNYMDVTKLLISSGCAGTAMAFVWKIMLRRDRYLMRRSTDVGEDDDLVY